MPEKLETELKAPALGTTADEGKGAARKGEHLESLDVAAKFYANLDPSIRDIPITDDERRRVRWKVDLMLVPILTVTSIISAVDKNTLSNAAIYGMIEDTRLVGNQYSIVGSLFFVGYALFEWPLAWLIQRLPVAKLLSCVVFLWGVLAMCTAASTSFAGLSTVRFISKFTEDFHVSRLLELLCDLYASSSGSI